MIFVQIFAPIGCGRNAVEAAMAPLCEKVRELTGDGNVEICVIIPTSSTGNVVVLIHNLPNCEPGILATLRKETVRVIVNQTPCQQPTWPKTSIMTITNTGQSNVLTQTH